MNIGFISDTSRKDLIENFCVAYRSILAKHTLYATEMTGRRIEQSANLNVHKLLSGTLGGGNQFVEMIQREAMDLVIFFYNPIENNPMENGLLEVTRACDRYLIPIATNIATAESMVLGMEQGDLDWRLNISREL